ncbi:hypothetical protein EF72_21355 [Salmonella enterica]|nr:hypothetical protein [Salmonella enterica]
MADRSTTNTNPGRRPVPDDIRQAARVAWESSPSITQGDLAEMFGLSIRTIQDWAYQEKWSKANRQHNGQVVPLPRRALNVVRREMAKQEGAPLTADQSRMLAMREHHRMRDERAQKINIQQEQLATVMMNALVRQDERQIARLKVGIDALSKLHKQQMLLWRINEGEMPCMLSYKTIDVLPDDGTTDA